MSRAGLGKALVFGGQLALYGYFLTRYGNEALTPLFMFAPATFGASFAGFAVGRKWSAKSSTGSRP